MLSDKYWCVFLLEVVGGRVRLVTTVHPRFVAAVGAGVAATLGLF